MVIIEDVYCAKKAGKWVKLVSTTSIYIQMCYVAVGADNDEGTALNANSESCFWAQNDHLLL